MRRLPALALGLTVVCGRNPARAGEHPADPPATAGTDPENAPPAEVPGETITIVDEAPRDAASEEHITREELAVQPRRTPGQLLMAAPGLFVGQHAGGGKADQIFLRGFDADHGTDVAISVDGVPVNTVSHAHGQGYADLHFVIPEVIQSVHVLKGPYAVDAGDFATAGSVRLTSLRRLDEPFITIGGGSFGTLRLVGASGGSAGAGDGWLAAEVVRSDGPFDDPQRLRRVNVIGKGTVALGEAQAWLEASSYGGGWNASGQIPLREVDAGRLPRFGSIDPTEGGTSARHGLVAGITAGDFDLRAYATRYRLDLFSDFTFALDDPANGDGIEQVDHRLTLGVRAEHHVHRHLGALDVTVRTGAEARADDADVALWHQRERARLDLRNRARIEEAAQGGFAEAELACADRWHVAAGGRADLFTFQVDDAGGTAVDGMARRLLATPKLRGDLRLLRTPRLEARLFGAAGGGFHSNDARNVVATGRDALPRAWGAEAGGRVRERSGAWEASVTGWGLWLEGEYVWVGDAGETDLRGATRRAGAELGGRGRILPWLGAELEATFTHARFATGERIPLAPALTVAGGLVAHHPSGASGQLRVRHLGDRPANEDASLTATGYTVVDLVARYRWRDLELELDLDNLTATAWREAQFAFESQLPGEPAPVEDIHFTPGVPLLARASLTCYY